VTVDHDVDGVTDRFTHRLDSGLGQSDRPQTFDRHRRRYGHRFERRKTVLNRLPRQVAELAGVLDRRPVEILHPPATQMTVGADVIPHRSAPELRTRHPRYLAGNIPQRDVDPRDRRRADNPVTVPKVLPVHHLPQMLDPPRILANHQFG